MEEEERGWKRRKEGGRGGKRVEEGGRGGKRVEEEERGEKKVKQEEHVTGWKRRDVVVTWVKEEKCGYVVLTFRTYFIILYCNI